MARPQRLPELLILGLICAGFGGAILAYSILFPDSFGFLTSDEVVLGFVISVSAFWVAVRLTDFDNLNSGWVPLINAFCIGAGMSLIIEAWLNYLDILTRSMFLIVAGGVFASGLLAVARRLILPRPEALHATTVMVGFDRASAGLIPLLRYPLAAVVGDTPYAGAPILPFEELEAVLSRLQPQQIIVAPDSAGRVNPSLLLEQRLRGVSVHSTAELYEELLGRISCAGRAPVDLMLSHALSGNQQAMVFQAIYTNLIGLILLIAASPVLAAAIATAAIFGSGPVLATEECCGFRNIPFLRMRFRTRRADGTCHPAGRLIAWLRLTDLPLLINVIRGEVALVGPRPVRQQFARRLTEIVPFYSMRFAVKPGIVSCGAALARGPQRSVQAEIEHDLYYVKYASPLLDLEILARLLLPARRREDSSVEFAPAA